ncbi:YopX family protein [Streptococcus suis]|uniref:YopX family protein n=3 Tax=Streptococcus suis TaxID=1307 RepID=UPI000CF59462|nr:YopX family protein [Streptococcus suis]
MIPKFRAWDKIRNRISEVERIYIDTKGVCLRDENGEYWRRFDDVILMQSTGLFDVNGKEVYIGDIVKCTVGCSHEVIFLKEYGGRYIGGMPAIYLSDIRDGYAWTEDEEIIGNIYENLELVEVNNDQ